MIRIHVRKMPIVRSFLTNVRFAVSCRVIELRDTVADPHQSEKPDPVPY
jgi:hypothetical protein